MNNPCQEMLNDFKEWLNNQSVKNDDVRWAYNDCLSFLEDYVERLDE
jgi:hypothetical protein